MFLCKLSCLHSIRVCGFLYTCCLTLVQVDTPPLSPYPIEFKARPPRRKLTPSHSIYISSYTAVDPPPQTPVLCYYFNSSLPKVSGQPLTDLLEVLSLNTTELSCSIHPDGCAVSWLPQICLLFPTASA